MPYITAVSQMADEPFSFDMLLGGDVDITKPHRKSACVSTVTHWADVLPPHLYPAKDIDRMIRSLASSQAILKPFDLSAQYRIHRIPKKSGGLRTICEPCAPLKEAQIELRTIFEQEFHALWHTSAYAYVKGRSIFDCVARHQARKSKWFLRLDFKDFFGQTNKDFVMRQLGTIAPFSEVMREEQGSKLLSRALDICFLHGGLPQGTPISPMLTNLVMIPIDHAISRALHEKGFVYTRYADDMQISHQQKFNPEKVIAIIRDVLRSMNAPYEIKPEKTRFGSVCGRNWNLGLMLGKEGRITIGHREHKQLKARLNHFILDQLSGILWAAEEVQRLQGQLAYFGQIEPDYAKHVVITLGKKHGVFVRKMLKKALKGKRYES